MMALSRLALSTKIIAAPVGTSPVTLSSWTPASLQAFFAIAPKGSSPSFAIIATLEPARLAATAWLEPLPPGPSPNRSPMRVSPISGRRSATKARSATKTPRMAMSAGMAAYSSPGGMTPFLSMKQPQKRRSAVVTTA